MEFHGSKTLNWRAHPNNLMVFNYQKDDWNRADIKRRALAVLSSYAGGRGAGEEGLEL